MQVHGQFTQPRFVALVGDAGQSNEVIHSQLMLGQAVGQQGEQLVLCTTAPTTQAGNHPRGGSGVIEVAGGHERYSCRRVT